MGTTPRPQSRPGLRTVKLAAGFLLISKPKLGGAMNPLRGEYGFLTQFRGITEAEARRRVRYMWEDFRILEFQFYDAMEGYSHPPAEYKLSWKNPFGKDVNRELIAAYVDEIKRLGGRAWLYVQAVGIDPDDKSFSQAQVVGRYRTEEGQDLLDVVVPTASWAQSIADEWAHFAKGLSFSGIHWDTLGNRLGLDKFNYDFPGFLREAQLILHDFELEQTMNFVDAFGWDASLWESGNWVHNVVAFPYVEAWTLPEVEDRFFNEVVPHGGGVFVCYPGRTYQHTGEWWNKEAKGIWPLDLISRRWQKARCRGCAYLAIGDGARHIQVEYFPDTAEISPADAMKLRTTVFSTCSFAATFCGAEAAEANTGRWWLWTLAVGAAFFVLGHASALSSRTAVTDRQLHEVDQTCGLL